jgi:hypothetical protein
MSPLGMQHCVETGILMVVFWSLDGYVGFITFCWFSDWSLAVILQSAVSVTVVPGVNHLIIKTFIELDLILKNIKISL